MGCTDELCWLCNKCGGVGGGGGGGGGSSSSAPPPPLAPDALLAAEGWTAPFVPPPPGGGRNVSPLRAASEEAEDCVTLRPHSSPSLRSVTLRLPPLVWPHSSPSQPSVALCLPPLRAPIAAAARRQHTPPGPSHCSSSAACCPLWLRILLSGSESVIAMPVPGGSSAEHVHSGDGST